jgi:hypothetical protein
MIAEEIARALERAAAALEGDDALAAAAALEEAERACAAAQAQGVQLEGEELAKLRELHRRGEGTAARAAAKLGRALDGAGCARRAVTAYGR